MVPVNSPYFPGDSVPPEMLEQSVKLGDEFFGRVISWDV